MSVPVPQAKITDAKRRERRRIAPVGVDQFDGQVREQRCRFWQRVERGEEFPVADQLLKGPPVDVVRARDAVRLQFARHGG